MHGGKSETMKSSFATLVTVLALGTNLPATAQTSGPDAALNLNAASSQYAQVPGSTNLTAALSQMTFEAWVNPRSMKCNTIISKGDGGNGALTDFIFQVGYDGSTCGVMDVSFFGGGAWDASIDKVALNTWTHVAVTFDGSNKLFYINGVLDRSAPRTNALYQSASPLYIGLQGQNCNCNNNFDGALDEVRIWSVVRSQQEIHQFMNQSLEGTEPGLVAYYPMLNGGTTLDNSSSTGSVYDATLVNSPTFVNSGALFRPSPHSSGYQVKTNGTTISGYVNPGNLATEAWFQWGTTTNYGNDSTPFSLPATNAYINTNTLISNVSPLTTNHFRMVATNSVGTNFSDDFVFFVPALPSATTLPATQITTNSATLNGLSNPGAATFNYYFFEYGLTTNYDHFIFIPASLPAQNSDFPVSNGIIGLSPSTTYHFALVSSNNLGLIQGGDLSFMTVIVPLPAAVTTLPATNLATTACTLNGTVNPGFLDTMAWFEWGTSTNYNNSTTPIFLDATNLNSTITITNLLTSLTPGATYHFRLVATNSLGATYGADQTFITSSLTLLNTGLPGIAGTVAVGDFNNDGLMDILLVGANSSGTPISEVWQNTGGGFSNINANLTGTDGGTAVWGDFDNDGRLDILLDGAWAHGTFVGLWQNTPGGFNNIFNSLPPYYRSSIALGDYDNDGLVDILMTGNGQMQFDPQTQIWRNTGSGFTDIGAGLPGVVDGSVAWEDFDNDGQLDILLSGQTITGDAITQIWRNTGGSFTNLNAGLPGIYNSSVAWGDFDNDGLPDLLIAGTTDGTNVITQVWRNTGNGFTNINAGLPGMQFGSVAWGDYDNDGRLDILLCGQDANTDPITQIWRNTGSGFVNVNAGLPGIMFGSAAWGDFNNDGRLDVVLAGQDANSNRITQVWLNQTPLPNSAPLAPTALTASLTLISNSISAAVFSWSSASDSQTPSAGLTYNLRVGTIPGGSDINNPDSSPSGIRHLPQPGNVQRRHIATLPITIGASYYWSVQAVDTSFAGSPFAAEHSFKLTAALTAVSGSNSVPGDSDGDGVISQSELAAVLANLDPRGAVDTSNFDLMLANYLPNSPWRYPSNLTGLGQTNLTFEIPDPITFTVQYSTNLINWNSLGTATPRYLFTDTNAPASQRYYRLKYP
jgi:hypothetical protein